jgi:hypothetical protein
MDSWISGEIKKGDLIIAIFNNWIQMGFYLGPGKGQSQQFYQVGRLVDWLNRVDAVRKVTRPYKSYVSNSDRYRFIKYSTELLCADQLEQYNKALEALKLIKI